MTTDGEQIRRQMLGEEWVRTASTGNGDALDHFAQLSIDHVWRAYWERPGVDVSLRSVATIAALASLEAHGELVAHVRGALRNGYLDAVQVRELLLHLTPYIGYPRARHAVEAVNDLLTEAAARPDGDGG
jgi:4-carboxymuconolactone decarboxylase